MFIKWLGHSAFYIQSTKGSRIVLDPYSHTRVKRDLPTVEADVVIISHEHADHNASWAVEGEPIVVRRTGNFIVEREIPLKHTGEVLTFRGYPTYHDKFDGRRYGENTLWEFYVDGMHVVFAGDLGHFLRETELTYIKSADILFVPIGGGNYTLDPREALVVAEQLKALIVIPMHFKTSFAPWVKEPVDSLLKILTEYEVLEKNLLNVIDLPPVPKYYIFKEDTIEDFIEFITPETI